MFTKFVKTLPDINIRDILDTTNPLSNIFRYCHRYPKNACGSSLSAGGRKRFGPRIKSDQRESGASGITFLRNEFPITNAADVAFIF